MYGAVIRGDLAKVKIGSLSNVQDRVVIKTVASLDSGFPSDVVSIRTPSNHTHYNTLYTLHTIYTIHTIQRPLTSWHSLTSAC